MLFDVSSIREWKPDQLAPRYNDDRVGEQQFHGLPQESLK